MSNLSEAYLTVYEGKDPSFQIKKSSGAGALSKEAAEKLGKKAVELRKQKSAAVDLPKIKKEDVDYILDKVRTIITEKKKNPCWNGYTQVGMKNKNGKKVPNCVPVKEEKDHEYSMARSELDSAAKAIKKIQSKLKGEGSIEAWVQSKITRSADYLNAASDYLDSGEHQVEEEFVIEKEMTTSDIKKEKKLKKKYDKSSMKQNMIDQYGKEKGTQIYFATIRKQSMANSFELEGQQLDEIAPLAAGALAAGAVGLGAMAVNRARQAAKSGVDAAKKGAKVVPSGGISGAAYNMQKRNEMLKQLQNQSFDYEDVYDYIIESLVEYEFVDDHESAENMFESISDVFVASILEDYLEEKARGTRKKTSVHAYDVDETLFSHGKKGNPNVKVHVNDESGKRVQSLSNQEFNTHKLKPGHKYDFSEFQSAKKFKETSSPNKKVIKDIKRKISRGHNVHLITARSKFDDPKEFHGHLKKHGIDVPMKNIHYTGGMKGKDIGDKKVAVANAIAKKHGASKVHMYDDAAKVHKSFEAEKKRTPVSKKIKTHMVKPDKSGESRVRSYQTTKEEMTVYEYWKQFINE